MKSIVIVPDRLPKAVIELDDGPVTEMPLVETVPSVLRARLTSALLTFWIESHLSVEAIVYALFVENVHFTGVECVCPVDGSEANSGKCSSQWDRISAVVIRGSG